MAAWGIRTVYKIYLVDIYVTRIIATVSAASIPTGRDDSYSEPYLSKNSKSYWALNYHYKNIFEI